MAPCSISSMLLTSVLLSLVSVNRGCVLQNIAPDCPHLDECPEILDADELEYFSKICCYNHHGLRFHCQEQTVNHKPNVIIACLRVKTCEAGKYGFLNITTVSDMVFASSRCLPCLDGRFEPEPKEIIYFRYPICQRMHQDCVKDYGKILVTKGSATRDAHCRCLWEEGYAPQDMAEECTSPLGFHRDTNCYCQYYKGCSENQRLNKDYECEFDSSIVMPVTPVTTVTSSQNIIPTTSPDYTAAAAKMMDFTRFILMTFLMSFTQLIFIICK